jgi:hypothetical protein
MRKDFSSCAQPKLNTAGSWIWEQSQASGEAAASSGHAFCKKLPTPTLGIPSSSTCCWTYFSEQIRNGQTRWRSVVALAATAGIAAPAFMSALAYYDGYRSAQLPANLLQAQRDYFGAHTYERTDQPRGVFFHLDWSAPDRPERKVQAG